ncbi:hypothetical protein [Synechococcus sp. CCY9202]|uniref:hypothetical protein n=1 Tax=Synechococcus sp. CCY9202 TaxID=174698 RepID=UPI002B206840|nr:hypothetical protein [Synechococcus sp. CCY9202]MEA5424472.1 hypothetical protein [Synechococcus sp. CCY9202]
MKCILHIGTEKTATTSFQKLMAASRDKLFNEYGIWYPQCLGSHWHRDLAVWAMDPSKPDDHFMKLNIKTSLEHDLFKKSLTERLQREYTEFKSAHTCIISSEHLHSRLKTQYSIHQLNEILTALYDEVYVFVHLRPQVELAVSLASTAAKSPSLIVDKKFFEEAALDRSYYDYSHILDMWSNSFGRERIYPFSFKKNLNMAQLIGGFIGVDLSALGPLPKENSSLTVEAICLLNLLKQYSGDSSKFNQIINASQAGEKLCVSRALASAIQDSYRDSNLKVIDSFKGMTNDDLFVDISMYPKNGNEERLLPECNFSPAVYAVMQEAVRIIEANNFLKRKLAQ